MDHGGDDREGGLLHREGGVSGGVYRKLPLRKKGVTGSGVEGEGGADGGRRKRPPGRMPPSRKLRKFLVSKDSY
ncbi:MAG: Tyrosine-protein kinase JAK2 [Methanothrix sp.]|nr:MAG: Tyrosine-protein kinase JAK2 [Methanothrix sp.]